MYVLPVVVVLCFGLMIWLAVGGKFNTAEDLRRAPRTAMSGKDDQTTAHPTLYMS